MNIEAIAFFTGLFGSIHCVSMCGPLLLALPFSGQSVWLVIAQKVLYQLGRILMYGLLGFIIGTVGQGFGLLGLQQVLSVITGLLLFMAGISYFIRGRKAPSNSLFSKPLQKLTHLLGKFLSKPYGGFIAGTLNGLLPCGVTYIALAQAVNLTTPSQSGMFMIFFGLGTLPLLFLTALSPLLFRSFRAPGLLVPTLFLLAGSFLVVRGLNLDIPYISHTVDFYNNAVCK